MESGELTCFDKSIVTNMVSTVTYTICIPIFELLIYPLLKKYIPQINVRIGLGMAVMLMGYFLLLAIDIYSHSHTEITSTNLSNSCMFYNVSTHVSLSPYSLVPVISIVAVGELLVFISNIEFICAQSPYSM